MSFMNYNIGLFEVPAHLLPFKITRTQTPIICHPTLLKY